MRPALRALRPLPLVLLVAVLTGCSHTPRVGGDSLSVGEQRVAALVEEARAALPRHFENPGLDPINPSKPCRRTVLGYSAGRTGTEQAERLAFVLLDPGADQYAARDALVARWKALGYRIDRSEEDDPRFERTRARVDDDYEIMVTAFADLIPVDGQEHPQLALYAVSSCLEP